MARVPRATTSIGANNFVNYIDDAGYFYSPKKWIDDAFLYLTTGQNGKERNEKGMDGGNFAVEKEIRTYNSTKKIQ